MPFVSQRLSAIAVRGGFASVAVLLGLLAGKNATLAFAAIGALAFVALMWFDFTTAICVLIPTTFLSLPGIVAKGIGLVLTLGWVALVTTRPSGEFENFLVENRGMTLLLLLFLAWTSLSVSWASSQSEVLSSMGRYVPNAALFPLIFATAGKRSHALAVVGMFVVGSSISAAYGVLTPPSGNGALDTRTGGTFGDPNFLAAVLVTGLILASAFAAMRSLAPVLRVAALGGAVLCIAGIALSLSRGGLIALGVALIVSIVISGRWRVQMVAVTVLVALFAASYFAIYASPQARARLTHAGGGSGRSDIWTVGWRMVQAHPLDGVGAGNFRLSSVKYLLRPGGLTHAQDFIGASPAPAHNTYLEVLAEGGIPALALLLGIMAGSLRCLQKAWRGFRASEDRDMELLSYALFAGLTGFLCASFFLSEEYSKQLWLLLAFGPLMLRVSKLPVRSTFGPPRRPRPELAGLGEDRSDLILDRATPSR